MNLNIHFILINSDFSQGLADDLYEGEESEDNIKNLWEDELQVSEPVTAFKIKNNTVYTLKGLFPNEAAFSFDIPDMTIVDCTTANDNSQQFAVSKKLLKKNEKVVDEDKGETHLYFYLRDGVALRNPINGIYIAEADFPKELLNPKKDGQA